MLHIIVSCVHNSLPMAPADTHPPLKQALQLLKTASLQAPPPVPVAAPEEPEEEPRPLVTIAFGSQTFKGNRIARKLIHDEAEKRGISCQVRGGLLLECVCLNLGLLSES